MNKSKKAISIVIHVTLSLILFIALILGTLYIFMTCNFWSSNSPTYFGYEIQSVQNDKMYFLWNHDGVQGLYCYDAANKTTTDFVDDIQMSGSDCVFHKNRVYLIQDNRLYPYNLETGERSASLKDADPFGTTLLYADDDSIWFQEYDALFRLNLKTKKQEKICALRGEVCDLKKLGGNIYFADVLYHDSTLYRIRSDGKQKKMFHADFSIQEILGYSENHALFFVADSDDDRGDILYQYDFSEKKVEEIADQIQGYYAENRFFYYFSRTSYQIIELNMKTKQKKVYLSDTESLAGDFIIADKRIYLDHATTIGYYDCRTNERTVLFDIDKTPA